MRGHDWINTSLPDELIVEIFTRLVSKPSRDSISLVCKRWLAIERLSRTTLRIGASGDPDIVVTLLSCRFPNVRNVYIDERLSSALPDQLVRTSIHFLFPYLIRKPSSGLLCIFHGIVQICLFGIKPISWVISCSWKIEK